MHGLDPAVGFQTGDFSNHGLRPELGGLVPHRFAQYWAGRSLVVAGVIVHSVGLVDLAAGRGLFDDEGAVEPTGGIERRGKAGRAATDDYNVVEIGH